MGARACTTEKRFISSIMMETKFLLLAFVLWSNSISAIHLYPESINDIAEDAKGTAKEDGKKIQENAKDQLGELKAALKKEAKELKMEEEAPKKEDKEGDGKSGEEVKKKEDKEGGNGKSGEEVKKKEDKEGGNGKKGEEVKKEDKEG